MAIGSSNYNGYKYWSTLEKYYTDNGAATGETKPNEPGDPDYVPNVYDTSMCPLPAFSVYYYDTYYDAYYNYNGVFTYVWTNNNAWVTSARAYFDQAKTINATIGKYYRIGEEIRYMNPGLDGGGESVSVLGEVQSGVPTPPAGMRAPEADYCDAGYIQEGYHDGYGGYYHFSSGNACF